MYNRTDPNSLLPVFARRLPIDDNQLHILCPAGIGDTLWFWSKWYAVAQARKVTLWFPEGEQHRSSGLGAMLGFRCGHLPGLETNWVWQQPGELAIPDSGAVMAVHPNKHLEYGKRIERWYPAIPFRNPCENIKFHSAAYKLEVGQPKYAVVFMCHEGYMEGNLLPGAWARIIKQIERDVAPVLLVGAGRDVPFAEKVCCLWDPTFAPIFNAPIDTIAQVLQNAELTVGVASGITILSTYLGTPTLHAYPHWLSRMAGAWEHKEATWDACFVDELEDKVRGMEEWGASRLESAEPQLKVIEP